MKTIKNNSRRLKKRKIRADLAVTMRRKIGPIGIARMSMLIVYFAKQLKMILPIFYIT